MPQEKQPKSTDPKQTMSDFDKAVYRQMTKPEPITPFIDDSGNQIKVKVDKPRSKYGLPRPGK